MILLTEDVYALTSRSPNCYAIGTPARLRDRIAVAQRRRALRARPPRSRGGWRAELATCERGAPSAPRRPARTRAGRAALSRALPGIKRQGAAAWRQRPARPHSGRARRRALRARPPRLARRMASYARHLRSSGRCAPRGVARLAQRAGANAGCRIPICNQ